jgi:hypothetical protein
MSAKKKTATPKVKKETVSKPAKTSSVRVQYAS